MKSNSNEKKIKVYLQYPWVFPDSPYYQYLIDKTENIQYLNTKKQKGVITNKKFFWFSNFLKRNIRRGMNILKLSIPNAHLSPEGDYDLIHCAHCLSKNKNKPWVADFEGVWQTWTGKLTKKTKEKIRKILLNKNCKKILPWTERVAIEFIKEFPEIKGKIEIVRQAIPFPKINKKKHQGINLLFVSRYFSIKGGNEVVEIFDHITKKYKKVNAIIVSDVPKNVLDKYSSNKKIKFYELLPQKKIFEEIYTIADINVFPCSIGTLSFVNLEAMAFGIPLIALESPDSKETIREGETGFIINNTNVRFNNLGAPIVGREILIKRFIEKIEKLIKKENLRKEMSQKCIREVKEGRFSIKERNKKLKKICEEALR